MYLGFDELPCGDADSYFEVTRNVLYDMAKLLVPKDSTKTDVDKKVAQLLEKCKNTQSDRHIVNVRLFDMIEDWRGNFLPLVTDNFADLSDLQKKDMMRMNNIFCGLHVVINLGSVAKEALKEFETIASFDPMNRGFVRSSARSCDLLYECSKAFVQAHGYQKAGVVGLWKAYIEGKSMKNHFVCMKGERINVLFAAGGGAYFHCQHVGEFLESCPNDNRLIQSLPDLYNDLYKSIFKALGIID